jgi:hypothetical protein
VELYLHSPNTHSWRAQGQLYLYLLYNTHKCPI